jgi:hypothetical protein
MPHWTKSDLTQEELQKHLHYNPLTGHFRRLIPSPRRPHDRGKIIGAKPTARGYRVVSINGISYLLHRLAWLYVHGCWPPYQIDHANGDRGDNRIANLRAASCQENQRNQRLSKRNKSGYKGVSWSSSKGMWQVSIVVNKKHKFLGAFSDPHEAGAAYWRAAQVLFAEFARAA